MKKSFYLILCLAAMMMVVGCKEKKSSPVINTADSLVVEEGERDSTIYGTCGEGTSMHNLQLITNSGDSVNFFIEDEGSGVVQGGLLSGDRLAVVSTVDANGENIAQKIINLTSLLGKWTSLDKNFEIQEGGNVQNNVKAETNPWTSWKILNGKLLLNKDTFLIDNLGPDSLTLENSVGIFVFKRQE